MKIFEKLSKAIILDEIIENSHIEKVEDVIFWALENYAETKKGFNGGIVANAIVERIKDAEKREYETIQNIEVIDSINL